MGFAELALICAVALLGPALAVTRGVQLPVVIGEMFVGVVIGRTGFRLVDPAGSTLTFMAQIGFALVMFIAGSHVPMRDPAMRSGVLRGALRAVGCGVVAMPLGFGAAAVFGTGHGALYTVLIASSSANIIMPVLDGADTAAPVIQQLLPQIAIANTACIVALPLAMDPPHALRATIGGAAVIAAGGVLFVILQKLAKSGEERRAHELSKERGLALELRFSLTAVFGIAAVAVATQVSVMLAGFVAGLAYAAVGEPRRLAHQLFAVTEGFFGPIFFVWLGASLDLRQLGAHPDAIVLGLVLGAAGLVAHGALLLSRQPWPAAAITAGNLGVPVAAAALGQALGMLRPGEAPAMLLGAVVTVITTAALAGPVRRLAAAQTTDRANPAAK
ncbi:cation:proton antiporter [Flexivirga caeni]|uniref:Cation:proton antiporter n=1 Tax=Flexivirga caeni TaxID=2294115 RepID=A0A3M9MCE1_9MICO|nr:cation:proton antiporter [Flexivirga caeni]RNI23232.1 cation:proton antiporter [Flexivirga caeni]